MGLIFKNISKKLAFRTQGFAGHETGFNGFEFPGVGGGARGSCGNEPG